MICQHIQSEVLIHLVPKVLEPNIVKGKKLSYLFIYSFAICFICNCSSDYMVDVHKDLHMAIVKTTGLWVVCITDGGYKLLHIVFFPVNANQCNFVSEKLGINFRVLHLLLSSYGATLINEINLEIQSDALN